MVTARKLRSEAMKGGPARAPNRSYLRAMGMSDEDIEKPFVAVASTWNEATPCNVHLDRLADRVKEGVKSGGGTSREFVTIAVSDGGAGGPRGGKGCPRSRRVVAG